MHLARLLLLVPNGVRRLANRSGLEKDIEVVDLRDSQMHTE